MTKKSKEYKLAEREELILQLAKEIVVEKGESALTMEEIRKRVDFSKGTLYNHFSCREDILVALHRACMDLHIEYFKKVLEYDAPGRIKYKAMGIAAAILKEKDILSAKIILNDQTLKKASETWLNTYLESYEEITEIIFKTVKESINAKDLPIDTEIDELALSAWCLTEGADYLLRTGIIMRNIPPKQQQEKVENMNQRLLDGYHWKPLSSEVNYKKIDEDILRTVFPKEAKELGWIE